MTQWTRSSTRGGRPVCPGQSSNQAQTVKKPRSGYEIINAHHLEPFEIGRFLPRGVINLWFSKEVALNRLTVATDVAFEAPSQVHSLSVRKESRDPKEQG
jgi:hypothetical protein